MTETIAFGGTTVEIETNEYNLIRVKFNGIATRWRYNPGEPFDMVLQDLIAMRAFDPIQDENGRLDAVNKIRVAWQKENAKALGATVPKNKQRDHSQMAAAWLEKHGY